MRNIKRNQRVRLVSLPSLCLRKHQRYQSELICYGRMTTSVSRSVALIMAQQRCGNKLDTDLFHVSLVSGANDLLIGTSIPNDEPHVIGGLEDLILGDMRLSTSLDPLTQFYQSMYI